MKNFLIQQRASHAIKIDWNANEYTIFMVTIFFA